jgi:hypothetical protein
MSCTVPILRHEPIPSVFATSAIPFGSLINQGHDHRQTIKKTRACRRLLRFESAEHATVFDKTKTRSLAPAHKQTEENFG